MDNSREFFGVYSPNRFICRGSGGLGKGAGHPFAPPRGRVTALSCCKYAVKVEVTFKK